MGLTKLEFINLALTLVSTLCAIISIVNAKATKETRTTIENNPIVKQILNKGSSISITSTTQK